MDIAMDRQSSPSEPARSSDFMRVESSVTAISWIPSEAISGVTRMPFDLKVGHYDAPPPDRIDPARLTDLRDADVFRFANHLAGTMEVEDGRITSFSQRGSGVLNNTHMRVAAFGLTFQAHAFPDLRPEPVVTPTSVTFSQTAGGRPGMPAPRLARKGRPALVAPTVWTTLRLTLHADGRTEAELVGGTPFPRHWVYGHDGELVQKTATISFEEWYERRPGTVGTPWGEEDSPVFVTMAETSLEREMSADAHARRPAVGAQLRARRRRDPAGRAGRRALRGARRDAVGRGGRP